MNDVTFTGIYVVAFLMLWRLVIVAFPFMVLLIVRGLMYGRMLMGLARKLREEYNKAGTIAEQVILSIRTVYSFVGGDEDQGQVLGSPPRVGKLCLKRALAKGMTIGSSEITFAIWSFMTWYGSLLVMYHGGQGGTVFVVGASISADCLGHWALVFLM